MLKKSQVYFKEFLLFLELKSNKYNNTKGEHVLIHVNCVMNEFNEEDLQEYGDVSRMILDIIAKYQDKNAENNTPIKENLEDDKEMDNDEIDWDLSDEDNEEDDEEEYEDDELDDELYESWGYLEEFLKDSKERKIE